MLKNVFSKTRLQYGCVLEASHLSTPQYSPTSFPPLLTNPTAGNRDPDSILMAEGAEPPRLEMSTEAPDGVKVEDAPGTPEESDVLEEDDDFEEFEDDGKDCLRLKHQADDQRFFTLRKCTNLF